MNKNKGLFITIEGIEGVGKSTALNFFEAFLSKHSIDFIVTREPGGTPIAEKVRTILLSSSDEMLTLESELLLMFAARSQHITQVIQPALRANKWVICDRYIDASYAYQGYGRGISLSDIKALDEWIVNATQPDMTILLDAPVDVGLTRAKHRGVQDRFEQEQKDFFERVRTGYLERAAEHPARFKIIDATLSLTEVQQQLREIITHAMQ